MVMRKTISGTQDRCVYGPEKQSEAQPNALAEKVLSKCLDRHIYVDTVVVLVKGEVGVKQKSLLRRILGQRPIVLKSKYLGYTHIRLHQPNIEMIKYISDEFKSHIISRVDVAVDFIAPSKIDAHFISKTILKALTMSWRRKGEIIHVGDTAYYGRKGRRRNIVAYHDRPSKITGEFVAHIEFRKLSAPACRSVGLYSLQDILSFDPVTFIRRQAKLSTINWPLVERHIQEAAGRIVRAHGKNYPLPLTREMAAARIKSINSRVIQNSDDFESFESLKESCPVQVFIDHQKSTGLMPKKFLDAVVTCDIYPLLEGAIIVRPMEKGKNVGLEIMRQIQERA